MQLSMVSGCVCPMMNYAANRSHWEVDCNALLMLHSVSTSSLWLLINEPRPTLSMFSILARAFYT